MILESFDSKERILCVRLEGTPPGETAGRLCSLAMVASDCGIESIVVRGIAGLPVDAGNAVSVLAGKNPLFMLDDSPDPGGQQEWGFDLVSRDTGFFCLSEPGRPDRYTLFISPDSDGVASASVFAYLVSDIMGFSSFMSFDVRFSLFELLSGIVRNPSIDGSKSWIRIILERTGPKLSASIHDLGTDFDPTLESARRGEDIENKAIFRGLGLMMAKKNKAAISYIRAEGQNRTSFEKTGEAGGEGSGDARNDASRRFSIIEGPGVDGGCRTLILTGNMESKGARHLQQGVSIMVSEESTVIRLDMEGVTLMSSAGVGAILVSTAAMRDIGGDIILAGVSRKIASVLMMVGIYDYLTVEKPVSTEKCRS